MVVIGEATYGAANAPDKPTLAGIGDDESEFINS